jgi:hypothetical protein
LHIIPISQKAMRVDPGELILSAAAAAVVNKDDEG